MPTAMEILNSRAAVQDAVKASGPPSVAPVRADLAERFTQTRQQNDYHLNHEILRICGMPTVRPMDEREVAEYTKMNVLSEAYQQGFRFFPCQAEAGLNFELYNGLLAPIGVGWGKTLITLLTAGKAFDKGIGRAALFIPSQVVIQLVDSDIRWARMRIPMSYPIHILAGKSMMERRQIAKSGRKGLYVFSYSLLSTKDTSDLLDWIRPELFIADEVQNLANRSAARYRRIKLFVEKVASTQPLFCGLSGTITSKSVMDYYQIIRWALKDYNPLPNSVSLAEEWANLIDADAGNLTSIPQAMSGPLAPLVQWARKNFDEPIPETVAGFRKAYQLRLTSAPGVVSTGDSSIGTSLIMANDVVQQPEKTEGWGTLQKLIAQVENAWLTPNGDEIEHAIHTFKWLYELTAGFYNELSWSSPENFSPRRGISMMEAEDVLEKSKNHHAAGQEYNRLLRKWLDTNSRSGIDTPMLVGRDMFVNGARNVGEQLFTAWSYHRSLDFANRPERDSKAIRVCPYKVDAVVQYVAQNIENGGVLIWVWHQEMGLWLVEELDKAGIETLHCPAGPAGNAAILEKDNKGKAVVASLSAHGVGKNLQHFQQQVFMQWPRAAKMAEQSLGRTHRSGQKADELVVKTINTSDFDMLVFAACLNDSLYIHQTTGNRQKLIYANYDPLPKIFPSAVLAERGMQNRMLSKEQERALGEKFGR